MVHPVAMAGAVEPFMQRKANDGRWMDGWMGGMEMADDSMQWEREGREEHTSHSVWNQVEHFDTISGFKGTFRSSFHFFTL